MIKKEKIDYYLTAFLIAGVCCLIFYPGIFSPDSFSQINQAITSNYDSWHPAIMAILMHYLYKPFGVGGLFILHQFLYWLAWALFFDIVLEKRRKTYLLTGFFTPFFLISLTVWKDTGMMISLFLGLILLYHFFKYRKYIILVPLLILFAYAFSVRTNGFIIVSSLIFILVTANWYIQKSKALISFIVGTFLTILCSVFFFTVNSSINKYFEVKQVSALPSLVLYDAAGIFYNAGLRHTNPPIWVEKNCDKSNNWISEYNEHSCSLCWTSEIKCKGTPELNEVYIRYWVETILDHPLDYVKHRLSFVANLFGISSITYLPFHSHKLQNQSSDQFHISYLGVLCLYPLYVLAYLLSIFHLYQPVLYILFSIYCFYVSLKRFIYKKDYRLDTIFLLTLSGSSIVNALSLTLLAVAADYRYMIWSVLSGFISILLIFFKKEQV